MSDGDVPAETVRCSIRLTTTAARENIIGMQRRRRHALSAHALHLGIVDLAGVSHKLRESVIRGPAP